MPSERRERQRLRRALAALGARGHERGQWAEAPRPRQVLHWLLPRAIPSHPPVAFGLGDARPSEPADVAVLIESMRARRLWWPAHRADAHTPSVMIDLRGVDAPEAADLLALLDREAAGRNAVALASPRAPAVEAMALARGLPVAHTRAAVSPEALTLVIGRRGGWTVHQAAIGGLRALTPDGRADPAPWLARLRLVDPWRQRPVSVEEGLDALALLRDAAQRNDRPVVTVGLSAWKRRNAEPFLAGPAGPPSHRANPARAAAEARREGACLVLWGMREAPDGVQHVLRLEDGFVRSVGLGIRHAPPASLAVDREGLYFDATRPTDFERIAREAEFPPELLARAKALRERLVALRITKYNLARSATLPQTDRPRLLVPGQVEGDASLRYGSPQVHENAALLRAARARNPDAFILYKPHPDVLTGLRPGAVDHATLAACADAVVVEASAEACLEWAGKVETMTSLMGFEALLRGLPVAVHGRPFYAGWGLTEAAQEPFDRGRRLELDALAAAALILYPRYIDPRSRLPAPPEKVLEWLHDERAFVRTPGGRAREAWRGLISRALNVVR